MPYKSLPVPKRAICPEGGAKMAKTQANYEVMYIIDATKSEEDIKALVERFKVLIEENGTLNELEEIGKRRLAYLINDMPEGYYVLAKFTSPPSFPTELKRVFGITDGILRSLITVIEE
jgi:small subunit ribosomal protein S6